MQLPLVAIPPPRRSTLFDAALEARRSLCVLEAPHAAPTEYEIAIARQRVLTQLSSVAQCIQAMAETGLLHTGLDARHTMQTSVYQPEPYGEWAAETIVTRVPPRALISAKWSPDLCSAVMTACVVMNVVARDHRRELVEYRQLARIIAEAWPQAGTALGKRFAAEWERSREQGGRTEQAEASPWVQAVQRVHQTMCAQARDCQPPAAVETGAIHALDFARRTLQWIGSSAESLGEEGEE